MPDPSMLPARKPTKAAESAAAEDQERPWRTITSRAATAVGTE